MELEGLGDGVGAGGDLVEPMLGGSHVSPHPRRRDHPVLAAGRLPGETVEVEVDHLSLQRREMGGLVHGPGAAQVVATEVLVVGIDLGQRNRDGRGEVQLHGNLRHAGRAQQVGQGQRPGRLGLRQRIEQHQASLPFAGLQTTEVQPWPGGPMAVVDCPALAVLGDQPGQPGEQAAVPLGKGPAGVEDRQPEVGRPRQPDLKVSGLFHLLGTQFQDARRFGGLGRAQAQGQPGNAQDRGQPEVHEVGSFCAM